MRLPMLILAGVACLMAQEQASYRGIVRIPYDVAADDQKTLSKGRYIAEIECKAEHCTLRFLHEKELKLDVRSEPVSGPANAGVPVMGAQFLRSSMDPLAPGQDRQFSKTGASQYEEETRDWKGVLRLYESESNEDAWFLFQERAGGGAWKTVRFRVKLKK
jgi:hypothetical protein